MDNFDFNDQPVKRSRPQLNSWDLLSILMLLITLCIGGYFGLIFFNPTTPLNPLPPLVIRPLLLPTVTITPIQLGPTWTPTPVAVTDTVTLNPTITLQPTATNFSLVPPTSTPTLTPTPKAPFTVSVNAIESIIIPHLVDQGCNWQGVAGTVDDANNSPIIGLRLRLTGNLNGKLIDIITVSGVSPDYGRSGFEFVLGSAPVVSRDPLTLQLLDQAGLPLADHVYIVTYNDCKRNLILVRFKKNR
jgi:hypothetical protein